MSFKRNSFIRNTQTAEDRTPNLGESSRKTRQDLSSMVNTSRSIPSLPSQPSLQPSPPPKVLSSLEQLPLDLLLYIASARFLTLNDIVQWRATASIFHRTIPLPNAAMILQAAHLFQARPQRGHRPSKGASITTPHKHPSDVHSHYKDRQLDDIMNRLPLLITHPDFQPYLLRSSYSFRHLDPLDRQNLSTSSSPSYGDSYSSSYNQDPSRTSSSSSPPEHQPFSRSKRTRRELQDYPIFLTGNPPDLVRLAIEFGHGPFVDHLLDRGFRPRDLPEYFASIPLIHFSDTPTVAQQEGHKKRKQELLRIWEHMRGANQELMDACSNADLPTVLKVLDATLIDPRPSLDRPLAPDPLLAGDDVSLSSSEQQQRQRHQQHQGEELSSMTTTTAKGKEPIRNSNWSDEKTVETDVDSLRSSSVWRAAGVGAGAGTSTSSSSAPAWQNQEGTSELHQTLSGFKTQEDSLPQTKPTDDPDPQPLFGTRPRREGDSTIPTEIRPHMPWVDGRALTSALLAVCFRRNGYGSPEAEAQEEKLAVPIVKEILQYDCMLTAPALGQAALAVAYSRPPGSLRRAHEQRLNPKITRPREQSGTTRGGSEVGVMDLMMERIGPREWLKLIKCYLQRQAFDDLAVVLDRCPFRGSQLERRLVETKQRPIPPLQGRGGQGELRFTSADQQQQRWRQQARELICREAGICGVGSRLNQFTGRGIGQASYNVAATLHESSRVLFTGSGTRFNHCYMLPRGGFRGIGGNNSGHTGSASGNQAHAIETADSQHSGGDSYQNTPRTERDDPIAQASSRSATDQEQSGNGVDNDNDGSDDLDGDEDEGNGLLLDAQSGLPQGMDDSQDSNLAFGGVGSSTTSSSRPGPGIVGIAIQVSAPDDILQTLLSMGFRFFSICDLSISDARHPLALQFRKQERMNRQLIEFSMVPGAEGETLDQDKGKGVSRRDQGRRRGRAKGQRRDDPVTREEDALTVQRFLHPAAEQRSRGYVSVPSALPAMAMPTTHSFTATVEVGSMVPTRLALTTSASSYQHQQQPQQPPQQPPQQQQPLQQSNTLPPSDRLRFVLPPVQLGESFGSLASLSNLQEHSSNDPSAFVVPLDSGRYRNNGFAISMPLPIRTSMIESHKTAINAFAMGRRLSTRTTREGTVVKVPMWVETTRRRVREFLSSKYMDMMTVGICLHQACYHRKEVLLAVILENRLLVAQDALTGAVQVAASVGWRRGLELLLLQQGELEAEIEPVVTTTSETVHLGTSMKWDYATAPRLYAGKRDLKTATFSLLLDSRRVSPTGPSRSLEDLVSRNLRRHRSDGGRLSRTRGSRGSVTIADGAAEDDGSSTRSRTHGRRASLDDSLSPMSSLTSNSPSQLLTRPLSLIFDPVVPTARSSSLSSRLSTFLTSSSPSIGSDRLYGRARARSAPLQNPLLESGTSAAPTTPLRPPTVAMLSAGSLWSLPGVMMLRKSRNAVVALMAACSGNDPALVHWLIETFADIKMSHILQALKLSCDRGLTQVVRVLLGGVPPSSNSTSDDQQQGGEGVVSLRRLLRRWMQDQFNSIVALCGELSVKGQTDPHPFLFLMESSPLFRHYYQILNTVSTCQFMMTTNQMLSPPLPPPAAPAPAPAPATLFPPFTAQPPVETPIPPTGPSQMAEPSQSRSNSQKKQRSPRQLTPQERKIQLVELLLDPILETFGPISVRLALDRMPRDCWWPLDQDVRTRVDQEARKEMVHLIKERKVQQQQRLQQQEQQQELQQLPQQQPQHRRGQVTSASAPILPHRHSNQNTQIEISEEVREVRGEKILEEGKGPKRIRLKFRNPWKKVQKWVARDHDKMDSEIEVKAAQPPVPKGLFRRWSRVK